MTDSEALTTEPVLLPQVSENTPVTHTGGPWPKGFCPNPGGRPKSKLISDALRQQLTEAIENGDTTNAEAIAQSMVKQAVKGRVDAATFVRDTTEGKPVQAVLVGHTLEEGTARRLADLAQALRLAQGQDEP